MTLAHPLSRSAAQEVSWREKSIEGFQSGRELIPCLKSGALEIDYEQLAELRLMQQSKQ